MKRATTWRLVLLAFSMAIWLAGFALLRRHDTWSIFAVAGPALAALALLSDPGSHRLLRPSASRIAAGLLAGAVMVLATRAVFALVVSATPGARTATLRLFELLSVWDVSPATRAALIAVIASCEEVVFRGAIAGPASPARIDILRVLALAAGYALATVTLGSPLLVACAFACGVAWGMLRLATGSLLVPILAHVTWDLALLVVWPLA